MALAFGSWDLSSGRISMPDWVLFLRPWSIRRRSAGKVLAREMAADEVETSWTSKPASWRTC